jgi:hypothetical protein
MRILELIQELEKINSENWNIEVAVQYRDSWWDYKGYDEDLYLTIKPIWDWKLLL